MNNAGLWAEGFIFFLVIAFAIHQLYDLRREKKKQDQKKP